MAVRNPLQFLVNGTVDNSPVGATTPAAGTFTTLIGGGGSANYGQLTGGATTKAVQFQTLGSDTNISLAVQPKGTGAIDLAAGSSGVNISNGGTVTALTRTAAGSGYTTPPTPTISVPTTASGVQATATCTIGVVTATVSAGGSGYVVGEILTVVGGTSTVAAVLTVATISGSAVATVTITTIGTYTASPTNPAATTSNLSGTGATFTLSFGVNSAFTITNAGSGYVEQPTVSFSGGGGSGASAYASVGSNPTIKSLTNTLNFATPAGTMFSVIGTTNADSYGYLTGGVGSAGFGVTSSVNNASVTFTSKGTSVVAFYTNNYGSLALNLSHTASAVNYVQVTGAATTASPVVSSQGSDANIALSFVSKGTARVNFFNNGTTSSRQFAIGTSGITTAVNFINVDGSVSGSAPSFQALGTDTNIDINLTPKGTGVLSFGTYTASVLTPTGYITIKDSGGTTRRLLVG